MPRIKYDFLIVGAGLTGCVFAEQAASSGKKVLVIDKRGHTGGNTYCQKREGINVHLYGAHIFHTHNVGIWNYIGRFAEFNNYINTPVANYKGKIYNLPFNMNTFSRMWDISTPAEAKEIIAAQARAENIGTPKNFEEKALSLVGRDIYEALIKGYTEKQWGKSAKELPEFLITRVPLRFTYDNNYFNDRYQGIPIGGYNVTTEKMLAGAEVKLNTDFFGDRERLSGIADKIIYTGAIDEYYGYRFGELEYRSLRFEHEVKDMLNYQGVAVMNFTDAETPYTRIIEHKHFEKTETQKTVITREYPHIWTRGDEPFYPVNDAKNTALYQKYRDLASSDPKISFAGRLGDYKYYDMDDAVEKALELAERLM